MNTIHCGVRHTCKPAFRDAHWRLMDDFVSIYCHLCKIPTQNFEHMNFAPYELSIQYLLIMIYSMDYQPYIDLLSLVHTTENLRHRRT